jgi:hypothetical protein
MSELHDRGMDGGDGYDSAADASSETRLRPVDENGQETWAEDAEPLTRGEYDEQVRQREAIGDYDSTDQDHDDAHEQDVAEDGQEQEELPEPRTRQEVGEEARSGADPLAHARSDAQQHEPDAQEGLRPKNARGCMGAYLDWRNEISAGREEGTNVVGAKPDRSPGDRRDLPPMGEELLDMDSDKLSRAEQFWHEFYKEAGDVADAVEKEGGMAIALTERPPTGSHTEVPTHQLAVSQPAADHATDSGQIALAGLVAGVLVFETAQVTPEYIGSQEKEITVPVTEHQAATLRHVGRPTH